MPPQRQSPAARGLALLLCALLAGPGTAWSTTFYVDAAAGADLAARDGLSVGAAWRSVTYALTRTRPPGPHELRVTAGEYSQASGERFPVILPYDMSLTGSGPDVTLFHDTGTGSGGTITWMARQGQLAAAPPTLTGFSVLHEPFNSNPSGTGVTLWADDVAAVAPRLTNVVISGASLGLDIYASAYAAPASLAPTITSCVFVQNQTGVLATAETITGQAADVSPTFTNCVSVRNLGEGMVFETVADQLLPTGQLGRATSSPVIAHCTLAENVASGITLDNTNGDVRYRSGPIQPIVTNSILTGNGDYALNEYTSTTDPLQFDRNLIGGNLTALYRDEGVTEVMTLAAMPMGTGNIDQAARFVRSLGIDWHLRGDSPGIDTIASGFAPVDLEGDARPQDGDRNGTAAGDMGADEAWGCAIDAVIDPAAPPERCGLEPPLLLSAAASAPAVGFTCTAPLQYEWYADGAPAGTGPDLSVVPPQSTTYTVVVTCPDLPECHDTTSVDVVVHLIPTVDAEAGVSGTPTGDYEACVDWDAPTVEVDLRGTAEAPDPGAAIDLIDWIASAGVFLGGTTLQPILAIDNTGENQDVAASLTVTDTNGCTAQSFTTVHVWRGSHVLPGGPYSSCQDVGATQTLIPLTGAVDLPTGSVATAWRWTTDVGQFEDSGGSVSTLQSPRLKLTNFRFNRTANLTLMVTDDKGCTSRAGDPATQTSATLYWTPNAKANGPYQQPEAPTSPTVLSLVGTFDGQAGTTLTWTTDLGTFQSTGTQTATGANQMLDVPNTGADQLGQVCLTATPPGGTCPNTECTAVSVRVSAAQPPNDIGGTLRIDNVAGIARLSWANPPIDATHDLADVFDAWEAQAPGPGGWTPRATLQDVVRIPGGTSVDDPTLLDLAGPDLLFLKIVSQNTGGFSCADPATMLPDCP